MYKGLPFFYKINFFISIAPRRFLFLSLSATPHAIFYLLRSLILPLYALAFPLIFTFVYNLFIISFCSTLFIPPLLHLSHIIFYSLSLSYYSVSLSFTLFIASVRNPVVFPSFPSFSSLPSYSSLPFLSFLAALSSNVFPFHLYPVSSKISLSLFPFFPARCKLSHVPKFSPHILHLFFFFSSNTSPLSFHFLVNFAALIIFFSLLASFKYFGTPKVLSFLYHFLYTISTFEFFHPFLVVVPLCPFPPLPRLTSLLSSLYLLTYSIDVLP